MTTPDGADTYAFMRAGSWDVPPGEGLPTLLGILGAGGQPLADQHRVLREWMTGPAYHGAPGVLKAEVREFLVRTVPPQSGPAAPRNLQQERWQARLDAMFPLGAIITWVHQPVSGNATAPVSLIRVAAMSGLDPVLAFYHPFGLVKDGKILTSLDVTCTKPHLIATARFSDGSTAQLVAEIPEGLRDDLAASRKELQASFAATS